MQKMLVVLIVVGLALWGFLLLAKYQPEMLRLFSRSNVDDANTSSRCAQYGTDVEGERTLDYGDRVKQFVNGCW